MSAAKSEPDTRDHQSAKARCQAELRAITAEKTLVTTYDERSFAVEVDAVTLALAIDAWQTGAVSPSLPENWETALAPLRRIIEAGSAVAGDDLGAGLSWKPLECRQESEVNPGDFLLIGDEKLAQALASAIAGQDSRVSVSYSESADWAAAVNRAFRTKERLVYLASEPNDERLIAFDRLCSDARTPWVAVELARSALWLGPFVTPGVGAGYEAFATRRLAAAYDAEAHKTLRRPPIQKIAGMNPTGLQRSLEAAISVLLGEWVGDLVYQIRHDGQVEEHPVLPLPGETVTQHRQHKPEDLVDPVAGIVRATRTVEHHPSVPSSLRTVQSDVCNMRMISRWSNNTSCQGSAFGDEEQARNSAIGEAVERYCGNLLDTLPVTFGSFDALSRKTTRVLDPDDLVLYSEQQYSTPGFPFAPMTKSLEMHWVPAWSLTHSETVLVPASMVYVNWFTAGYSNATVTNFCPFAGIAAGPSWEYAVTSALEEIIERHVTMVWWLNAHPFDATDPASLCGLWSDVGSEYGQRPSLLMLDNEFNVPVAAGVLHNDRDTLLNVGFACRDTPEAAAAKAWTEALTLQEGSRDLLRPDGLHWAAMKRGELNARSFKPWRSDRRYLPEFRADMRDCDDLMVQQQVYLDPEAQEKMVHLLDRPVRRALSDTPRLRERGVRPLQEAIEANGHEVLIVDITSPDIASAGLSVVRAIVPGTVGNAPAAFPFLGKGRVQELAVQLGWRSSILREDQLNYFPLPHA